MAKSKKEAQKKQPAKPVKSSGHSAVRKRKKEEEELEPIMEGDDDLFRDEFDEDSDEIPEEDL